MCDKTICNFTHDALYISREYYTKHLCYSTISKVKKNVLILMYHTLIEIIFFLYIITLQD